MPNDTIFVKYKSLRTEAACVKSRHAEYGEETFKRLCKCVNKNTLLGECSKVEYTTEQYGSLPEGTSYTTLSETRESECYNTSGMWQTNCPQCMKEQSL